jgi:hypothetical protein
MIRQVTSPVQWADSMRKSLELYTEAEKGGNPPYQYIELGPGNVLQNLAKQNLPKNIVQATSIGTVEDIKTFIKEFEKNS